MDGWTDGRMDGRTDGWMDGRTDGWTDRRECGSIAITPLTRISIAAMKHVTSLTCSLCEQIAVHKVT
jgi:hypothetical protein